MNKKQVSDELAKILEEPDRDFIENPITRAESDELIMALFSLVGDPKTPEGMVDFYISCLNVVKSQMAYH